MKYRRIRQIDQCTEGIVSNGLHVSERWMDGNTRSTYEIVSTQKFQVSNHSAFLQVIKKDGAMWGIFRGVREDIFEGYLPRLWILIVQELEELELIVNGERIELGGGITSRKCCCMVSRT
jgi:hypothetical protein